MRFNSVPAILDPRIVRVRSAAVGGHDATSFQSERSSAVRKRGFLLNGFYRPPRLPESVLARATPSTQYRRPSPVESEAWTAAGRAPVGS